MAAVQRTTTSNERLPLFPTDFEPIPEGYCQCGCGEKAKLSGNTHARWGYKTGQPRRFLRGHNRLNMEPLPPEGPEKTCSICKLTKPIEEFGKASGQRKRRAWCRPCECERVKKYHERKPGQRWKTALRCFWGMTVEDYAALLKSQRGVCAICGRKETALHQNGNVKRLAVDHCHETKKVRGLLCKRCNCGIGEFEEDPERLMAAVRYLKRHTDGEPVVHKGSYGLPTSDP